MRRHAPSPGRLRRWVALCALTVVALGVGLGLSSSTRAAAPLRTGLPTVAAHERLHPQRPTMPELPTSRQALPLGDGTAWAHPPAETHDVPSPVTTVLHGACGDPAPGCALWERAATERGWLLCPSGPRRCGDAWDWSGSGESKRAHLDAAIDALVSRWPGHVAAEGHVLVGFSRGAFAARDILYAGARYRGVIFIGAAFVPDAAKLRAQGVRRVVFACGDHDGARPTMVKATATLLRHGLQARFVSTGRIWHQLPADLSERMKEPLAWVGENSVGENSVGENSVGENSVGETPTALLELSE